MEKRFPEKIDGETMVTDILGLGGYEEVMRVLSKMSALNRTPSPSTAKSKSDHGSVASGEEEAEGASAEDGGEQATTTADSAQPASESSAPK